MGTQLPQQPVIPGTNKEVSNVIQHRFQLIPKIIEIENLIILIFLNNNCKQKLFGLDEDEEFFGKEIAELLKKSQQSLAELQADVKEVQKISGEAVVNVRKIKTRPLVRPPSAGGSGQPLAPVRNLNIKQSKVNAADEVIDE